MKKIIKLLPLVVALFVVEALNPWPLETLRLKTFDAFTKTPGPSGNFVILNIDDSALQQFGQWPWPRQTLADLQAAILQSGATGIGWVMTFPEADRMGGDAAFAEALKLAPSVIGIAETDGGAFPAPHGTVTIGSDVGGVRAKGFLLNVPELRYAASNGAISGTVDVDGLIRQVPVLLRSPDGWVASFGVEVLKILLGQDTYQIKTGDAGIESIRVRGLPPVPTDGLGKVWLTWPKTPVVTLAELPEVAGKFVFVGVTAKGIMPQLSTPAGLLEPHFIQAALAENVVIAESPFRPNFAPAVELLITLGVMILVVVPIFAIPLRYAGATVLCVFAGLWWGGIQWIGGGLLLDMSWPTVAGLLTGGQATWLSYGEQYRLRLQIKKQFEHYLDPRQIARLQKDPDLLKLGGERTYATLLFTDVRGFTALSEALDPDQVTYIMNRVLTAQTKPVLAEGGMVDKFIGDAMMAVFGAPLPMENQEQRAAAAARGIQAGLIELNKEFEGEGLPQIGIGIGINSGYAVIGNMGSDTRFDYSCIGDAVNVAARLESATKEVGAEVLIGETSAEKLDGLRPLEPIMVKGKSKPLSIYTFS